MMTRSGCAWIVCLMVMVVSFPLGGLRAADTGNPLIQVIESADTSNPSGVTRGKGRSLNRVLAMVDDEVLTMSDYLNRYGDTRISRQKMRPLVNELLLQAAAKEEELVPEDRQVDSFVAQQVQRLKNQYGQQFSQMLQVQGLTESEYRQQMHDRIRQQMMETRLISRLYPEAREADTRAAQVHARARLMLVENPARAWQIYGWLQDNPTEETWNKLYQQYSKKIFLMGKNGDLGWFRWGHYDKKIEYRVFSQPLYSVSKPFPFRERYALVYPTGYRITRSDTTPQGARSTFQQFRQKYYREQLYERLRRNYDVIYPTAVRRELGYDGTAG